MLLPQDSRESLSPGTVIRRLGPIVCEEGIVTRALARLLLFHVPLGPRTTGSRRARLFDTYVENDRVALRRCLADGAICRLTPPEETGSALPSPPSGVGLHAESGADAERRHTGLPIREDGTSNRAKRHQRLATRGEAVSAPFFFILAF
jgi:hypothetical protein